MQNAKWKMQQCIMMQKANVFVFFELTWDNKEKVCLGNPRLYKHYETTPKQSTKVKET